MARSGHEVLTLTEIEYQGPIKAALAAGGLPPGLRFEFFMPPWLDRLRHLGLRLGYESLTLHLVHLVWQIAAYRHVLAAASSGRGSISSITSPTAASGTRP